MTKFIQKSLLVDSRRQTEKEVKEIGECLESMMGSTDLRRSCALLKSWYLHTSARAQKSLQADMYKVTGDYTEMYQREEPTPPGRVVPTHVKPFGVNGGVKLEGGGRGSGAAAPYSQVRREQSPPQRTLQEMDLGGVSG